MIKFVENNDVTNQCNFNVLFQQLSFENVNVVSLVANGENLWMVENAYDNDKPTFKFLPGN